MIKLQTKLTIEPDGSVLIPANMLTEAGIKYGGKVLARMVDEAVILEFGDTVIRRAQAMVRHC